MKSKAFLCVLAVLVSGDAAAARGRRLEWKVLSTAPSVIVKAAASQVNLKVARVARVSSGRTGTLYLVDPNSINECGSAGCLVLGFLQERQAVREVLGVYVPGRFPPPAKANDFVRVMKERHAGLPCLVISGGETQNPMWCFKGEQYAFHRLIQMRF